MFGNSENTFQPLLDVCGVSVMFDGLPAVDGVSFSVAQGECLGLVGESGSGKSTVARAILHLQPLTNGSIFFEGNDISAFSRQQLLAFRRKAQMVFQDPFASLNPRQSVGNALAEVLKFHKHLARHECDEEVVELLEDVGLAADHRMRYPHEFSGGQRQRICIARALAVNPTFIVADEPVSALDVSVQSQILNLLQDLQEQRNLTYLFIAHDLAVVNHMCERTLVMHRGQIVEEGSVDQVFFSPEHEYTKKLLASCPA